MAAVIIEMYSHMNLVSATFSLAVGWKQ
jgi:hypothetical protein